MRPTEGDTPRAVAHVERVAGADAGNAEGDLDWRGRRCGALQLWRRSCALPARAVHVRCLDFARRRGGSAWARGPVPRLAAERLPHALAGVTLVRAGSFMPSFEAFASAGRAGRAWPRLRQRTAMLALVSVDGRRRREQLGLRCRLHRAGRIDAAAPAQPPPVSTRSSLFGRARRDRNHDGGPR